MDIGLMVLSTNAECAQSAKTKMFKVFSTNID
jgi:hypothetical protein